MPLLRIDDRLSVPSSRKIQDTGTMLATGAIARTGVLKYKAKELGDLFKDKDPEEIVTVAQLQDNLFSEEVLQKFEACPITLEHPADDVNTENMKDLSKGMLQGKPTPAGDKLEAVLAIADKDAINAVDEGTSELSVCAYYNLVRTEDGEYDAIREITRVNHVAIVDRGRAGRSCKIYDHDPIEVVEVKTYDQDYVDAQEAKLSDAIKEAGEWKEKCEVAEAKVDALNTKLEDAQSKILTPEAIEEKVVERVELLADIRKLSDVDVTGLSAVDSKRKVLKELLDNDFADKSDAYVDARFDFMLEDWNPDTQLSQILRDSKKPVKKEKQVSAADKARLNMIKRQEGGV